MNIVEIMDEITFELDINLYVVSFFLSSICKILGSIWILGNIGI